MNGKRCLAFVFILLYLYCVTFPTIALEISEHGFIEKYNDLLSEQGMEDTAGMDSNKFIYLMSLSVPNEKVILLRGMEKNDVSYVLYQRDGEHDIMAVEVLFDDESFPPFFQSRKDFIYLVCRSLIKAFCLTDDEKTSALINKIFNGEKNLRESASFFQDDFVYQSGTAYHSFQRASENSFSITRITQSQFNNSLYITPTNWLERFHQLADLAIEDGDYDKAISLIEQTGSSLGILEDLYQKKDAQLQVQVDDASAYEVLQPAGLTESDDYTDLLSSTQKDENIMSESEDDIDSTKNISFTSAIDGTWKAVYWYDFMANQGQNVDVYQKIPDKYLEKSPLEITLNITNNFMEVVNNQGLKSSGPLFWIKDNVFMMKQEDDYEESDFIVIDENQIHSGSSDGIIVFNRTSSIESIQEQAEEIKETEIFQNGTFHVEVLENSWREDSSGTLVVPYIYIKITNISTKPVDSIRVTTRFIWRDEKEVLSTRIMPFLDTYEPPLEQEFSIRGSIESTAGFKSAEYAFLAPDLNAEIYVNDDFLGVVIIRNLLH